MTIGGNPPTVRRLVWYRSFLAFQPDAALMAKAPLGFQLPPCFAFGLFALWPFTLPLVHVVSAPVGYLTRPYIVTAPVTTSWAATGRVAAGTESHNDLRTRPLDVGEHAVDPCESTTETETPAGRSCFGTRRHFRFVPRSRRHVRP